MDFVETHPLSPRLAVPLRAALRGQAADWPSPLTDEEVDALVAHGVAPLAYAAAQVPELRAEAIRAAALEALRAAGVKEIVELLHDAGVTSLLMKGAALAYDVYPFAELRPRGDTDLLVAPESAARAREVLLAHGFEQQRGSGDDHGMRQAMFTRYDRHGIRHSYDLHWDAVNVPMFSEAFRFASLDGRSVPLARLGGHARALAAADALLLACVHRVAHHHGSDRLVWLYDIALLLRLMTEAEHAAFWHSASRHGAIAICRHSIALATAWTWTVALADPRLWLTPADLVREEPSAILLDRQLAYGQLLLANLGALPPGARIRRIWQLAFPPADYLRATMGAGPLPLLWGRRSARGIRRLFRRASTL